MTGNRDGAPGASVLTLGEAVGIRQRCCTRKRPYGARTARLVAEHRNSRRAAGNRPYVAYRCPFGGGPHWHVGRLITVAGMARLAQAIRTLHQAA